MGRAYNAELKAKKFGKKPKSRAELTILGKRMGHFKIEMDLDKGLIKIRLEKVIFYF